MTQPLTLSCGAMRCELAPALGGAIAGLWHNDVPVLRSTPSGQLRSVRESASYPLVPFSNRIGHGQLHWAGVRYPLAHNFAPEPHAIHGVGWQRPWLVQQTKPDYALLSLQHEPDDGWPFAFHCAQSFQLGPDRLTLSLQATNRSGMAVPMGLGWHPYFVKRASAHLRFAASGRWEMGADKLPTVRQPLAGLDTDCATLDVDHCFDGWVDALYLRDAVFETTVRSSLSHLVVFTNPQRDFVAIEPVSHVNNALQLAERLLCPAQALGLQILQSGESLSAHMAIGVAPVR